MSSNLYEQDTLPPILIFDAPLRPEHVDALRDWSARVERAAKERERNRIIALAYAMEEQNLTVSAGRIAAAANMVVECGPLHMKRDGDTVNVTQDVRIKGEQ